jgi:hypothetical protein
MTKVDNLKLQIETIIDEHNQCEDYLSLLKTGLGSDETKYRRQKVPEYPSLNRSKSPHEKSKVNVVKRYVKEFDNKYFKFDNKYFIEKEDEMEN